MNIIITVPTNQRNVLLHCSVTEVKKNEEYSVGFVSDGRQLKLNVYLGTNFPNEKPRISISPRIRHEWVQEQTGEVQNAPGLVNVSLQCHYDSNLGSFSTQ